MGETLHLATCRFLLTRFSTPSTVYLLSHPTVVMSGVPVPFSDIAKPANDLLNKDFYHTTAANLEVKSKAPNGVTFNVKGKSAHDGPISGSIEGKYSDKAAVLTITNTWNTSNSLDFKVELEDNRPKASKPRFCPTISPRRAPTA